MLCAPALIYHPSHPIALHASQTVEYVLIKIYRKMYRNPDSEGPAEGAAQRGAGGPHGREARYTNGPRIGATP